MSGASFFLSLWAIVVAFVGLVFGVRDEDYCYLVGCLMAAAILTYFAWAVR